VHFNSSLTYLQPQIFFFLNKNDLKKNEDNLKKEKNEDDLTKMKTTKNKIKNEDDLNKNIKSTLIGCDIKVN
jgi:hypothetical protein